MAFVLLPVLLGLLGSSMKPLPFVAALVPVLATGTLMLAFVAGLSWLAALAAFYGGLAVAEFCYFGAVTARHWPWLIANGQHGPSDIRKSHSL